MDLHCVEKLKERGLATDDVDVPREFKRSRADIPAYANVLYQIKRSFLFLFIYNDCAFSARYNPAKAGILGLRGVFETASNLKIDKRIYKWKPHKVWI